MSEVTHELRCGNCGYWIGESVVKLSFVEFVERGTEAELAPPRDQRICGKCKMKNIFIRREEVADRRSAV